MDDGCWVWAGLKVDSGFQAYVYIDVGEGYIGGGMRFDHLGIAVKSVDKAGLLLEKYLGYRARTEKVENTRQQVIVKFYRKEGQPDIKLIEPSSPASPLVAFLRKGEGLHHIGYRVADTMQSCTQLKEIGAKVTADPEPGEGFEDALIAFLYLGSGISVELFDTDSRRGLLPECDDDAHACDKTN